MRRSRVRFSLWAPGLGLVNRSGGPTRESSPPGSVPRTCHYGASGGTDGTIRPPEAHREPLTSSGRHPGDHVRDVDPPGFESQMAMDVIPRLYQHLKTRGDGVVPWRIVSLIREFCHEFTVLVAD